LDIKPYVPYTDCVMDSVNSIAPGPPEETPVVFSDLAKQQTLQFGGERLLTLVQQVITQDPRPQYQKEVAERIYGLRLDKWNIQWCMMGAAEHTRYFEVLEISQIEDVND
jgi:hypothetical protein